jgi:hypothetical protein
MATLTNLFQASRAEKNLLVPFIPSADRYGKSLGKAEQQRWVRKALKFLGKWLRGGTAFPRGWGVWRDDAQQGRLVWDRPVVIQCFTDEDALRRHVEPIRNFLIDLGNQTRQGAVGFVIDRSYYEIEFPIEGE